MFEKIQKIGVDIKGTTLSKIGMLTNDMSDLGNMITSGGGKSHDDGMFDTMFVEIRQVFGHVIKYVAIFVKELPEQIKFFTTEIAFVLVAGAIIGLAILWLAAMYASYFAHPRLWITSRSVDIDGYMKDTFFSHFLKLRDDINNRVNILRSQKIDAYGRSWNVFDLMSSSFASHGAMPPVATLTNTLPTKNVDCMKFILNYYKCHSAYNKEGSAYFSLPEDQDSLIDKKSWTKIEILRNQIRSFVDKVAHFNASEDLWIDEKNYKNAMNLNYSWKTNTSSQVFARDLQMFMSRNGISYEKYIYVAQAVAFLTADFLELNLMLNAYHESIVIKYDSRQRRAWGNPYIFYYFLDKQTSITMSSIKDAWGAGFTKRIIKYYWTMHQYYDGLWSKIIKIPLKLAQMGTNTKDTGYDGSKTPGIMNDVINKS
jgi:hypothetical protein